MGIPMSRIRMDARLPFLELGFVAALFGCAPKGRESAAARSDSAAAYRADSAQVNGTTLFYDVQGSGPVIVFAHGGGFDHRMWDDQVSAFRPFFTVVRYDARGFGRSASTVGAPFQYHEDLAGLIRHLGYERVSVVGQSLGGRVAVDLALTHPDLVEKLVLVGPGLSGWPWDRSGFESWIARMGDAVKAGDSLAASEAWLSSSYMAPAMERPELRDRLRMLSRANVRSFFENGQEPELDPPAMKRLRDVRAPVLLVIGTRDEPEILKIGDTLTGQIAGVRRVMLEAAGHAPNIEQPERFNQVVLEFLRSSGRP